MRVKLLVIALCLAVCPGSASALTVVEPAGSHFPYQRWAEASKMPTPEATIEVIETGAEKGCPNREMNFAGCTRPSEGKVWLAPELIAGGYPRGTFYHEVGHNVDFLLLPEWMRLRFMAILEMEGSWDADIEKVSYWPPSEKFAQVYAECAIKPVILTWENKLGLGPIFGGEPIGGRHRHNQLCRMLKRL